MVIVVMGVTGAGKSTLANALAVNLGWVFLEGDEHHPEANIAKMARGEPLDDQDRAQWLQNLHTRMVELDLKGENAVVSCSALKACYRDSLAEGISNLRFVFLHGTESCITDRLKARQGHFMPTSLLGSQLVALEPPENAIMAPIEMTTDAQIALVLQTIQKDL